MSKPKCIVDSRLEPIPMFDKIFIISLFLSLPILYIILFI